MNTGVLFPTTEIGTDPIAIRDFAQAAESLGFDHMLFYDHVLGANEETPAGRGKPWRHTNMFHEPLVLFGYLAGVTRSIELATSILILPQRQTALVAKQAAAADVLSGGRLRLGIRVGMNPVEYEGMGAGFSDRGARTDEQIEVLRMLWTRELVTFEGRWHRITDAGINPLPVQRPIPLWIGGSADRVVRRLARLGDGWMFAGGGRVPDGDAMASLDRMRSYAREAGRGPICDRNPEGDRARRGHPGEVGRRARRVARRRRDPHRIQYRWRESRKSPGAHRRHQALQARPFADRLIDTVQDWRYDSRV